MANPTTLTLKITDVPISHMRALTVRNLLREYIGKPVALDYRPTRKYNAVRGSDSNASSRQGLFVTTEHSPRGIRTGGWQLCPPDEGPRHDPGPREGVLERRSVPLPEKRKYYSKIAPPFDAAEDSDDDDYDVDNPESDGEDGTSENKNENDASESDEEGGTSESEEDDDASDDDDEEGDIVRDAGEDDVSEDAKEDDGTEHSDADAEIREG
jgi:hypothetical protein